MEMQAAGSRQDGGVGRFEGVTIRPVAPFARVAGGLGFLGAAGVYFWMGGAWWLALVLLLAPDLAFLGFAVSTRFGVTAYNAVHRPLAPATLLALGLVLGSRAVALLMLIWIGHIAMDRAAGYGLKRAPVESRRQA
jgi:hypothetical protein